MYVVPRGVYVLAEGRRLAMTRARVCVVLVVAAAAVATSGCSGDKGTAQPSGTGPPAPTVAVQQSTVPPRTQAPEVESEPGAEARVVVRGSATLDGAPLDAEFLGAIVRKDGLITPCQATLPPVKNGQYEITVMGEAEASGCGGPGSEILLWSFANDTQYFSRNAIAWPGNGRTTTFAPSFTTATPDGDVLPRTEIAGEVFERDGRQLPPRTRVEAFVDNTLCGVASVRTNGDFTGFSLSVVGPQSVAGCTEGGTVTFRVDGRQTVTTTVNDFRVIRSLDLTLP